MLTKLYSLGPFYFLLNAKEFLLTRIYQGMARLVYPFGIRFPKLALYVVRRQTGDISALNAAEHLIREIISGKGSSILVPNYLEKAFSNMLAFLPRGSRVIAYKNLRSESLPEWLYINLAMVSPIADKVVSISDEYRLIGRYQGFFILKKDKGAPRDSHYQFLYNELKKMALVTERYALVEKCGHKFKVRTKSMDENIVTEVREEYFPWFTNLHEEFDTVIDLGAQIGGFSINATEFLSPDGKIHSFEPEPANFAILRENIVLNNLSNRVFPHNVAVGDKDGTATLAISSDNTGGNKIGVSESSSSEDIIVPIVDAMDVIDRLKGKCLLKIDVEGWEYPVIKRLAPALDKFSYIIGEAQKSHFGSTQKTLQILRNAGFEVETRGPEEQLIFFARNKFPACSL